MYRRHVSARARFIRVIAKEIALIRGQPRICTCILTQAIDFANKHFPALEINYCDWNCDNHVIQNNEVDPNEN